MPYAPVTCPTSTRSSGIGIPDAVIFKTLYQRSGSGFLARLLDQTGSGRRQLRANALPVGQTVLGDAHGLFSAGSHRIVEADALDETAVATIAGIGHNQVEERTLLCATTG